MGYTHYFPHGKTTLKKWGEILDDCEKLAAADDTPIVANTYTQTKEGWDTKSGAPIFDNTEIRFNGVAEASHEDFLLLRGGVKKQDYEKDRTEKYGFTFCKTAAKPYDLLVCACLLVYVHYSPDTIELGSDGGPQDWAQAEKLVKDVLGYDMSYSEITGETE